MKFQIHRRCESIFIYMYFYSNFVCAPTKLLVTAHNAHYTGGYARKGTSLADTLQASHRRRPTALTAENINFNRFPRLLHSPFVGSTNASRRYILLLCADARERDACQYLRLPRRAAPRRASSCHRIRKLNDILMMNAENILALHRQQSITL